jgi:hypothetical protein
MTLTQHDTRLKKSEAARLSSSPGRRRLGLAMGKLAILALIVGLVGLATMAKDGQYFPTTNPARHVSLSTKMNVAHPHVVCDRVPLKEATQIEALRPLPQRLIVRRVQQEPLPIQSVGVTVSLQHRSPPPSLS